MDKEIKFIYQDDFDVVNYPINDNYRVEITDLVFLLMENNNVDEQLNLVNYCATIHGVIFSFPLIAGRLNKKCLIKLNTIPGLRWFSADDGWFRIGLEH